MKYGKFTMAAFVLFAAGWAGYTTQATEGDKKVETRVFEMRTYYANPGKMTALHARFRDHTNKLFVKHGMTLIGYWPVVVLITLALLTTLYHAAIPVRTPWHRAMPGAVLGLIFWVVGSTFLRMWLVFAFRSTATYGPLSAPVAVLLFLYLTALAILLGAELNAEIDRLWPTQATQRARREVQAAHEADAAAAPRSASDMLDV